MAKQTFTTGQVLTAAQVNSLQANDFNQTVSVKTANYTLVAADKGTRIEFNTSGSVTCTVNSGLFDAGDTLVIQNRGAGTATITAGTATVNTSASLALAQYSAGTLYFISNSAALFFGDAAGISASIVDAKGDLIVGTADNTVGRLAVGTNGYTLVADSAQTSGLKWAVDPVADVVTTAGDLIYGTGADAVTRLGIGTAGQVLTVNSGATAPQWAAASAASGPAFKARRTADQNVASANTWVKVQLNAEVYDTDNCFDSTTNYRFTPTKAGYYQFNSRIYFPIANDKVNFLALYKNGTVVAQTNAGTNGTNANMGGPPGLSDLQSANGSSDYFEIYAYSTSAGNDIGGGAEQVTYLSGVWIRGL